MHRDALLVGQLRAPWTPKPLNGLLRTLLAPQKVFKRPVRGFSYTGCTETLSNGCNSDGEAAAKTCIGIWTLEMEKDIQTIPIVVSASCIKTKTSLQGTRDHSSWGAAADLDTPVFLDSEECSPKLECLSNVWVSGLWLVAPLVHLLPQWWSYFNLWSSGRCLWLSYSLWGRRLRDPTSAASEVGDGQVERSQIWSLKQTHCTSDWARFVRKALMHPYLHRGPYHIIFSKHAFAES